VCLSIAYTLMFSLSAFAYSSLLDSNVMRDYEREQERKKQEQEMQWKMDEMKRDIEWEQKRREREMEMQRGIEEQSREIEQILQERRLNRLERQYYQNQQSYNYHKYTQHSKKHTYYLRHRHAKQRIRYKTTLIRRRHRDWVRNFISSLKNSRFRDILLLVDLHDTGGALWLFYTRNYFI
jgi:hypothetical protein